MRGTGRGRARAGRRWAALLALAMAWLGATPAQATAIAAIAVGDDQVEIRFDGPVGSAQARVVAAPRRIAIDLPDVVPAAHAPSGGGGAGKARQVVRPGGGARVELDLTRAMAIGDGALEAGGRRLVLNLVPVDRSGFTAASLAGPVDFLPFDLGKLGGKLGSRAPQVRVTQRVPPPARSAPLPRVAGEDGRPLVVIDAGHGGFDPGAISPASGLREKDVTLKIAKAIRDELVASGRVRVALTRDKDRFLVLRERFGIARRLHADLFISIHCDSTGTGEATGASVYTLSEVASDKEAARLAARENKADLIAGVNFGEAGGDVSSILIDLTQRETMNASATFARLLGREARPLMPLKPVFHRMASLMVLKAPDMPSVLFETGYISNPADAAFLNSDEGRGRIAESVRRAVEAHFARRMVAR